MNNDSKIKHENGDIFPFTVNTQLRFIDGEWKKFYTIFNNDGSPISETPRTAEEIQQIMTEFFRLL